MGFTVRPEELRGTGKVLGTAAGTLRDAEPAARKAEAHASQLQYRAATAMAEAVAQKAGARLTQIAALLSATQTGLGNAAATYEKSDHLGHEPR